MRSGLADLDPPLRRFFVVNAAGIGSATVLLAAMYAGGVRHGQILDDLAVMVVATAVLLSGVPLAGRFGAPGLVLAQVACSVVFSFGATWVTPFLSPLAVLVLLVPVMVAYPYLGRRSMTAVTGAVVVLVAVLAAMAEWRRDYADPPYPAVAVVSLLVFAPAVVVVIAYSVNQNYRRLWQQARELQESRTRVAAVADAARRGLERDLHDGAQQRLVGMSVRIGALGRLVETADLPAQRDQVRGAVRDLAEDNLAAIAELRELARGIYPPLLAERGLTVALGAAARRSALPCTVDAAPVGRWPAEVESAVYFCILEALQNAAKHSGAQEVSVVLAADPDLAFTVSDDGVGFEPGAGGWSGGLLGMEARVQAAGGELVVSSSRGSGTRVQGRFPSSRRD